MMHDMDGQPIEVDNAKFVDFIDATEVCIGGFAGVKNRSLSILHAPPTDK